MQKMLVRMYASAVCEDNLFFDTRGGLYLFGAGFVRIVLRVGLLFSGESVEYTIRLCFCQCSEHPRRFFFFMHVLFG